MKRGRGSSVYQPRQHNEEDQYMQHKAADAEAEFRGDPPRQAIPQYLLSIDATDHLKRFFYFTLEGLVERGGIKVLAHDEGTGQPTHFKIINGEISGHAFDPIFLPETHRLISGSIDRHHRNASSKWFRLGWRAVSRTAPLIPSLHHYKQLSRYLTDHTFRLHPTIFFNKGGEFRYFDTQNPIFQNINYTYYFPDAFKTSAIDEQLTAILRRRSEAPGIDELKRQNFLRDITALSLPNLITPRIKIFKISERASEPSLGPRGGNVFDDIDPRLLTIPRSRYGSDSDVSSDEEEILLTSHSDLVKEWESKWATNIPQEDAAGMNLPRADADIIDALEKQMSAELEAHGSLLV